MNNIENIQEYIPTVYVNDSEPDLDETNLNKTEQAIKRVTDAANKAIDALKQLDREKLALSAISNVLSDATDKVPSLALANTMQLAINDLNSNLDDIGLGRLDSIKSVSISDVYQLTSDYPNQYVTFVGASVSNLPVSGNYRYVGRCLRFGQYVQIDIVNMETYVAYQNYNRGLDSGGQWIGWKSTITNSDFSSAVKTTGVSAGKAVTLYVSKLNDTQNYVQFFVDGVDKGYITFDVSRNIK